MGLDKIPEINIEDIFADTNLEIDEIESIIKLVCCALENPKYNNSDIKDIDSTLFMLQGKLNNIKNKLRVMQTNIKECKVH